MFCQLLFCLLSTFVSRATPQVIDADCVTADGSVGRCVESSKCTNIYHQVNAVLCRYARGYGTRICCPRTAIMDHLAYTVLGEQEDSFKNERPLLFPGEAAYSSFKPHGQSSNTYVPYSEDSYYRPQNSRPSYNKPSYSYPSSYNERPHSSGSSSFETPSYSSSSGGKRPSSSYDNPSYSGGYDERPSYSSGSSGYGRPSSSSNSNGYPNQPSSSSGTSIYQERPSYSSNSNGYQRPDYSSGFLGNSGSTQRPGSNYNSRETTTSWELPSSDRRTTPRPSWAVEDNTSGSSSNSRRRISEQKCEEYIQPVSMTINALPLSIHSEAVPLTVQMNCDFSAIKLIVGGEVSELGEFPHMAAVGYRVRTSRDTLWNCGGTLISERYVLTASHCANTSFGNPVVVRLGEHNIERDDDGADPQDYKVQRVITHPNYLKTLKYNDIALLRLDRDVRFSKFIRPACLPTDNNIRGRPVATGWGRTDFVGRQSEFLMKVGLNVIDNRQCNTYYNTNNPGSASFASGIVDTMLCAGYVEGGRDTCLGDSGGPLTITKSENPCIHYVVGITSFGKICAAPKSPGVYTRVVKYLDWIERNVWP